MKMIGIDEQKRIEFEILKSFRDYCDKNGLRYFLYAGTLLGAIRHKGFIPWDDDIDVCMPRPDYEKFYQMVKSNPIAPHISAVTYRDVDNCICPFIKLQDNRTDGHEDDLREEYTTSVWVDIFPIDGAPEAGEEREKYIAKVQPLVQMISLCSRAFIPCKNPLKLAKRMYISKKYGKVDVNEVDRQIENEAMRYRFGECKNSGVIVFINIGKSIVRKEVFDDFTEAEFEGEMFKIPILYKELLEVQYGDYMTPPPEKDRHPMHNFRVWWKDGFEKLSKE